MPGERGRGQAGNVSSQCDAGLAKGVVYMVSGFVQRCRWVVYVVSLILSHGNLLKLRVSMSRVTYVIPWAHTGHYTSLA